MVSRNPSRWSLFQTPKQPQIVEHVICNKALAIPEILENIISNLSYYIIQNIVSLVCRDWLSIARRLSPIKVNWSLNLALHEHKRILSILPKAQVLCLTPNARNSKLICDTYPDKTYRDTLWKEIIQAIQDLQDKDQSLRSFTVCGELINQRYFQDLLPLQSRTTVLKLDEIGIKPDWRFLRKVFRACPMLDEFHVQCWNFSRSYIPAKSESESQGPLEPLPVMSIRVLVVKGLIISPASMEAIVMALPNVVELRILGAWRQRVLAEAIQSAGVTFDDANGVSPLVISALTPLGVPQEFNHTALFRLVAQRCRHLKRFHFSIHDQRYTESDLATLMNYFPSLSDRSFAHHELPLLMNMILSSNLENSLPLTESPVADPTWNYITTLELIPLLESTEVNGNSLHKYLCTAVHLRRLIAPNVLIRLSDLKPPSSNIGENEETQTPQPKIWACRNLQILHISFKGTAEEYASKSTTLPLFAYVSVVCPQLVHLQVRGFFMDLTLPGGLCLVSRLKNLEKITIIVRRCLRFTKKDFAWLKPFPTLINKLTAISTVMKSQNQQQKYSTKNFSGGNTNRVEPQGFNNDDRTINWSIIEKANDLEEWATEQDLEAWKGEPCLPRLDHFQLLIDDGHSVQASRHLESFLKDIRPHANINLEYKKY
ncbi:hypothetical protein BGZ46_002926 [Entomortierella lignicola]|nr:hypothetical protein BGZ46_002926 [Entomortierella lignicola]